jgi:hypothetical protein
MESIQLCLKGTNVYFQSSDMKIAEHKDVRGFGRRRRLCEIRVEDDEKEEAMGPIGIRKP